MKISVIAPVKDECAWIGYSVMAALPYVDEFVYTLDEKSEDGTRDILYHLKEKYAHERLTVIDHPSFHPHDLKAYNEAYNVCLAKAKGDAVMFLHPDMIVTEGKALESGPIAWWVSMRSFTGDLQTEITKGRTDKWKNIHLNKFGIHYFGAYGSQNEDFYHKDITGKSYKHYGNEFNKYPFRVSDSGFKVNHYCEAKDFKRRLEKMKLCLKTLYPSMSDEMIHQNAVQHPRVTLEPSSTLFGQFAFDKTEKPVPEVFAKYKAEFSAFLKEPALV